MLLLPLWLVLEQGNFAQVGHDGIVAMYRVKCADPPKGTEQKYAKEYGSAVSG